jgi:hypothetical protein
VECVIQEQGDPIGLKFAQGATVYFFANYAYSVLTQDNMMQPEVGILFYYNIGRIVGGQVVGGQVGECWYRTLSVPSS